MNTKVHFRYGSIHYLWDVFKVWTFYRSFWHILIIIANIFDHLYVAGSGPNFTCVTWLNLISTTAQCGRKYWSVVSFSYNVCLILIEFESVLYFGRAVGVTYEATGMRFYLRSVFFIIDSVFLRIYSDCVFLSQYC